MRTFEDELRALLNRCSQENGSNTTDYILAEYLGECLRAFNFATKSREHWYSRYHKPGAAPSAPTKEGEG